MALMERGCKYNIKSISRITEKGIKFIPDVFENGDTRRLLLSRSRHILMKHFSEKQRTEILFREYPPLKKAYSVSMELTHIYNKKKNKGVALGWFAHWYEGVEGLNCKFFRLIPKT